MSAPKVGEFGEPLSWSPSKGDPGHGFQAQVWNARGEALLFIAGLAIGPKADALARRVSACVNACASIPTESLERGAVAEAVESLRKIVQQVANDGAGVERQMDRIDDWARAALKALEPTR